MSVGGGADRHTNPWERPLRCELIHVREDLREASRLTPAQTCAAGSGTKGESRL